MEDHRDDYQTIRARVEDRIGFLTLDRPNALNAINGQMIGELTGALGRMAEDPQVLAVVLHGEGRAFSAGFDLKEAAARATTGADDWRRVLETDFDFIMQFWDCPKPTIAAVHGHCIGGGFEMMLACDITVAGEDARFGEPEVRFGSGIVALLLPWVAGPKATKELLLTGRDRVSAARAYDLCIVNHVVPDAEVLEAASAIAREIAAAAPNSVRATKRAINRSYEIMGMRQALLQALEAEILIETSAGPERKEFNRIRQEQGLKAALAWRDGRL